MNIRRLILTCCLLVAAPVLAQSTPAVAPPTIEQIALDVRAAIPKAGDLLLWVGPDGSRPSTGGRFLTSATTCPAGTNPSVLGTAQKWGTGSDREQQDFLDAGRAFDTFALDAAERGYVWAVVLGKTRIQGGSEPAAVWCVPIERFITTVEDLDALSAGIKQRLDEYKVELQTLYGTRIDDHDKRLKVLEDKIRNWHANQIRLGVIFGGTTVGGEAGLDINFVLASAKIGGLGFTAGATGGGSGTKHGETFQFGAFWALRGGLAWRVPTIKGRELDLTISATAGLNEFRVADKPVGRLWAKNVDITWTPRGVMNDLFYVGIRVGVGPLYTPPLAAGQAEVSHGWRPDVALSTGIAF